MLYKPVNVKSSLIEFAVIVVVNVNGFEHVPFGHVALLENCVVENAISRSTKIMSPSLIENEPLLAFMPTSDVLTD